MFRAVVSEITLPASALRAPPADVNTVLRREKTRLADIIFVGPSCGAVEVFGILCEFASAMTSQQKEDTNAQKTANEYDQLALKERPANPLIR
jgi:hypothetical protein